MNAQEGLLRDDLLMALDILDLDEEIIDSKLDSLTKRTLHDFSKLKSILVFLKYKYMICIKEETDCENDKYVKFAIELLVNSNEHTDVLLDILSVSLNLNSERFSSFAEHIVQQMISSENFVYSLDSKKAPVQLKIVDTVLDLCIQKKIILNPMFLASKLEKIVLLKDKLTQTNFFLYTVPMFIKVYKDYLILNLIWENILQQCNNPNKNDFIILCSLSDYYLPVKIEDYSLNIKSTLIKSFQFWKIIKFGFTHNDYIVRKCSLFLARRAIQCATDYKAFNVIDQDTKTPLFVWKMENKLTIEQSWSNLCILLETLEEKQTNLVIAALKLFDNLNNIEYAWYRCAVIRALTHEASSVLSQVIPIVLKNIHPGHTCEMFPFSDLTIALNNTFLYEHFHISERNPLRSILYIFLSTKNNLEGMIEVLSKVKLSSIPQFYIFEVLMTIHKNDNTIHFTKAVDAFGFGNKFYEPNNLTMKCGIQCCFLNFIMNNSQIIQSTDNLITVIDILQTNNLLIRDNQVWKKMITLINKCKMNLNLPEFKISISDINSESNMKQYSSLIILLTDSDILHSDEILNEMNHTIQIIKELENREYSSDVIANTKFDLFIHILQRIFETTKDDDYLKKKVVKILGYNIIAILNYIQKQLRKISKDNYNNCSRQCIKGLDILMKSNDSIFVYNQAESLINIILSILKSNCADFFNVYCSLKLVSIMMLHIHNNENLKENEKSLIICPIFDVVHNLNTTRCFREVSDGRLISDFHGAVLDIYFYHYSCYNNWNPNIIDQLFEDLFEFLEMGGYGCLLFVIKLSHILFSNLSPEINFHNTENLIERIWKEIFDQRKNDFFKIYIKSFIKMVFQTKLLSHSIFHELLKSYSEKIFDLGDQIPTIIYEFIDHLNFISKDIGSFSLIPILVKGLLFGVVLRKDQRIENEIYEQIHESSDIFYTHEKIQQVKNPVCHIRMVSLNILSCLDNNVFVDISLQLLNSLDEFNKPNNRYHGNSLQHRILLRTLQFLLFSVKIHPKLCTEKNFHWCIQRLISQPHHISSKIFLEWYISLYIINMNLSLKYEVTKTLNISSLPQVSYFMIIYHVLKHRILHHEQCKQVGDAEMNNITETELIEDFNFVIQELLPFTMGQLFNIRLHAQYLTLKLLQLFKNNYVSTKYDVVCDIILKNFEHCKEEKNLIKLSNDFYINKFDVFDSLSLNNIYYNILRLTGVAQDEWISASMQNVYSNLYNNIIFKRDPEFDLGSWVVEVDNSSEKETENDPSTTEKYDINIQKKFVPWNVLLSEMGITSDDTMKPEKCCELVVVASLIDKLPNLGGLARTCEVFGVKDYVIDSMRHLKDKQFQTLSMSSEKWLHFIEKRPGSELKNYLMKMKTEGYLIVAAEQTSSSVSLDEFKFPKRTILIMGHEKEGIPCDLLNLMDFCVEIPQHGKIRSLNVHVTASIFIWEYLKQYPL